VTVRTELVEVCRSCFDKLSTNGGCNCPKLKTLYKVIFDIFLWINKMVFGMFFVQTTLAENLL
ncbi:hypothetical protein, partial [Crenothrix polyspora]|uniref:hypothetical protein n=1 Tax=Crenothrix polyspora TaxID=360316 RepID=UPI001C3E8698